MTLVQIIAIVIALVLVALAGFFIMRKSQKNTLVKWIILLIVFAIVLTWILPYGYYDGATYYEYGMSRTGFTHIPNILYNLMYMEGDRIIYLLSLGAFYGVLSKARGYKKLVGNLAKFFKGKEYLLVAISTILFTVLSAFLSQTLIVLLFVPFVISIMREMKLDKITAFVATFGAILVGTMGTIFGGDGFYWFNNYVSVTASTGMVYRIIILAVTFLLFNFFTFMHLRKVLKDNNSEEVIEDPFEGEKLEKKAYAWPTAIVLGLLFIISILAYVDWSGTFGITIFDTFHQNIIDFKIFGFDIFNQLLGANSQLSKAFGYWNLFQASILLIVLSLILALINLVKPNDIIDGFAEGMKKISKPLLLVLGAYMVMLIAYMSPFIPTFTNAIATHIKSFNPYFTSFIALISNIFHVDFGFTGYIVAPYFTVTYAEYVDIIHTIFTSTYGLVGFFAPTSAVLLIGLSYLKLDYKKWLKYIWMFLVALLVLLLILFTILTYI